MSTVEKAITWMESTATNNRHGYDQQYRWGERGDYDCSSAVITAWQLAGIPVRTKGATYTGNMQPVFMACGFRNVTGQVNLHTGAGLVRGDVLLNRVHHVAMYCGNGMEVEASINEKGKAIGGIPGDQTGREFLIRTYRNYPWQVVLRYVETTKKSLAQIAQEVINGTWGKGTQRQQLLTNAGYDYVVVQSIVNALLLKKSIPAVAQEVVLGKWGNGIVRQEALLAAGYDFNQVQAQVSKLLKR